MTDITETGEIVFGSLTETGQIVANTLTETGRWTSVTEAAGAPLFCIEKLGLKPLTGL